AGRARARSRAFAGTRLALVKGMQPLFLLPLAALPWLQGFFAPSAVTERGAAGVVEELAEWRAPVEDCVGSSYGGLELRADVSDARGEERILASYTQGVF